MIAELSTTNEAERLAKVKEIGAAYIITRVSLPTDEIFEAYACHTKEELSALDQALKPKGGTVLTFTNNPTEKATGVIHAPARQEDVNKLVGYAIAFIILLVIVGMLHGC